MNVGPGRLSRLTGQSTSPAILERVLQLAAALVALSRLARGRRMRPPLAPAPATGRAISVVVPARNEEARIRPCLEALRAEDVLEVIVVDDRSDDGTAVLAASLGARVVEGRPPPDGWVGKPWALQQGLEAARGEVVVSLDADTRPLPGLPGAMAAELDHAPFITAGPRFVCETPGERWMHPSFLATLVYRFGPSNIDGPAPRPARVVSNGQCTAVERAWFLREGGYGLAPDFLTDDIALARTLARRGHAVRFVDASALLEVRMHESPRELWREWGRSIAAHDVTPPAWQAADLFVVWLAMGVPVLRAATGRARRLDWLLLAIRFALLGGMRRSYVERGAAFWLSPLADPLTALRLTLSTVRPAREWRGRRYVLGPGRAARRSS